MLHKYVAFEVKSEVHKEFLISIPTQHYFYVSYDESDVRLLLMPLANTAETFIDCLHSGGYLLVARDAKPNLDLDSNRA